MSNTNFMPFKIFCQGALGVIIYKMYHPYTMKVGHSAKMELMFKKITKVLKKILM